jgi:NADPH-dependent 2,4-dienoyl-CoA reductase/sulfur reductase-like enzyme
MIAGLNVRGKPERGAMKKNSLLIIGGSDAGISAALRAREIDPSIEPTLVVADRYPNFSICGLPFYLSGEVSDWRSLAHRTKEEIEQAGIRLLMDRYASAIDPEQKLVTVVDAERRTGELQYDRLIVATGAESIKPDIKGMDLPGVFLLRWMADSFRLHKWLIEHEPKSALIVGGGYIGMEMADALSIRGLSVKVVEFADTVLTTVDKTLGQEVASELERHGVKTATAVAIESIEADGDRLIVNGTKGFSAYTDMVLVAVGCRPSTALASGAGIQTGLKGAIKVSRRMETNLPDIYAAGDCVETWHNLLGDYAYLPLGTTAHKQGRVAGENASGGNREFEGSLGTQAVKIFDLVAACTGLRDAEAQEAGFASLTDHFETWDHKVYYPGADKMIIRITGDRESGRLLGAQILGHYKSEVSKRVDIFAAAIFGNMTVEQLSDLDLSYTPPLSSPWDPIQMASQAWVQRLYGR